MEMCSLFGSRFTAISSMPLSIVVVALLLAQTLGQAWNPVTNSWDPTLDHASAAQPWMCHHYTGDQQETRWCATVGYEGGYEFKYTEGGVGSPCFPCWCCKRENDGAPPPVSTAVSTTEAAVSDQKYLHRPMNIHGVPSAVLVGEGGTVSEDLLIAERGAGFTLFSSFNGEWTAEGIAQLKLMGKAITFTVDLSRVGCACNLAFYLISSPTRDWNGKFSAGTNRGGQPPFYCDANEVGGQWCPEIDIMEANNHAFQSTPHKCDAPTGGHYNSCDRGGCTANTRDKDGSYGPGEQNTIDTTQSFEVRTEFVQDSGSVLTSMRTILRQAGRKVVLHHSSCSSDYLAQLSDAMTEGMSLRITYWGDKADTMSWMDSPPCGPQACSGANSGRATISNMSISSLPKPTEEWESDTPSSASASPSKQSHKYVTHAVKIDGFSPAVLAGDGGSVEGDALTIQHNAGFSLFSKFHDAWEANNIAQLELLGRMISFTVDLSKVGCACNLAFYLVSSPAHDWNGELSAGENRGGQPPFYCDANEVGGQWCPEIDIMEANNHAFQATPHKCDEPTSGHYNNCDRGGCDESTRDQPDAYGPGASYTIDTREPFVVQTEFPQKAGVLIGMRTILRQSGKEVTLKHDSCDADYLAQLSDAMAAGMSLRITYWGDRADTMSWMDSPPCGPQACTGASAGHAVIRNMSIGVVPKHSHHGSSDVWAISDPTDELFKQVVPDRIVEDPSRFVSKGNLGIADWKNSEHFVKQVSWHEGGDLNMIMRRNEIPSGMGELKTRFPFVPALAAALVSLVAFVVLRVRRTRLRSSFHRLPADSGTPILVRADSAELVMLEAACSSSDLDNVE